MTSQKHHFRLFSNCFPVVGATESLIYDLQRNQVLKIPSLLAQILLEIHDASIDDFKKKFKNNEGINLYLNELERLEIGFFIDNPESFPPMNLNWESPYQIENAILEIESTESILFDEMSNILKQLDDLGCQALQIRMFSLIDESFLKQILDLTKKSKIKFLEFFLEDLNYDKNNLCELSKINRRLNNIVVHSSTINESVIPDSNSYFKLIYTKQIIAVGQPEIINTQNFIFESNTFIEAQSYNIGLNKKVCIDNLGNIKNFLSHLKTFGNIQSNKIKNIVLTKDFQEKWFISNDQIEKCKDCQFRYVCINNCDIEGFGGKYYKVFDCGFDPMTNQWKN